ncbi:hypothetical protein QF038_004118 [Pseudarthrobacter sp. W1I19]|nr:hypothetical protein [Pseudarthrobacter sp. W1I19]MDQ0925610.1 hypothetical protein [Pseudarthrobacter sp. W1I19]
MAISSEAHIIAVGLCPGVDQYSSKAFAPLAKVKLPESSHSGRNNRP